MRGGGESEESSVLETGEKKVPISKGGQQFELLGLSSNVVLGDQKESGQLLETGGRSNFLRVGMWTGMKKVKAVKCSLLFQKTALKK